MKVLHLDSGQDWRGGQQQVLYLAEGLRTYPLEQRLAVRAEGELARRLELDHLPSTNLPFRSELDPASLVRLWRILKEFQPDIIHAHDSRTLGLATILHALNLKFHLVASRRVAFPIRRNLFSKVKYQRAPSVIIAVSSYIRNSLIESGIDPVKVKVIYDGLLLPHPPDQETRRSIRKRLGVAEEEFLLGSYGHFTREKGHETLVRGFKQVQVLQPRARLLIVGEGPLFGLTNRLVRELGLEGRVILPGAVANPESVLPALDLFVYPSLTEGLGSVIIMAMACRVPVCASRTGGIPELVADGFTGRLFSPGDPEGLAEVVVGTLQAPAQMNEYVHNAFTLVTQQFVVERMVSSTFNLYSRVIERAGLKTNSL